MRTRSELAFSLVQVVVDLAAVTVALLLACILEAGFADFGIALLAPLWSVVFASVGLYELSSARGRGEEVRLVVAGVIGGLLAAITADFFYGGAFFGSRREAAYLLPLALVGVTAGRLMIRHVQHRLLIRGIGTHHVVIVGSGPIAQHLLAAMDGDQSGFHVIASVESPTPAGGEAHVLRADIPVFPSLEAVFAAGLPVEDVLQADSRLDDTEVNHIVDVARSRNLNYRYSPNSFRLLTPHSAFETIGGSPIVLVRRSPLDGWSRIVKRAFDVVVAGILLVVLAPLLCVVGALVKLGDAGPMFYAHRRLARNGRKIDVYKFRTMRAAVSSGPGFSGMSDREVFASLGRPELADEFSKTQKVKDDPRVTRVGDSLRRLSLDELPQLFNVLRGDLSLVGPRPIVGEELDRYGVEQWTLLSAKPGVTGLWQVSGRNDLSYDERVRLDLFYIENWSLWLDVRILVRTIGMVLHRRGAY